MTLIEWMKAEGRSNQWLAAKMQVSEETVSRWRKGRKPSGPALALLREMSNGTMNQWETDNA
jgi:DNA-binding transcriptional regulator YiaG